VLRRFALEPTGVPETTRRRSITFSPARGATVVLHDRTGTVVTAKPVAVGV
jgi:hypothetical protein